ncbi:ATP-binding cassette, subfamily B [Carnobacterium alterfunditum]|uniref:ATP-binding cassette, subfamily B n=2 Tax=Carnobacterium alterfunditum TaxID=28230 RepID=A0A1N6GI89_9LACT|nr:ATP-binding cassette, subfamily B [Carnobacterium alterfunditum]
MSKQMRALSDRPLAGKKPDNFKESIGKLANYCKIYIWYIVVAIIFAVFGTIFNLVGPNRLSEITDIITSGITGEIDLEKIKNIGLFLAVLYVIGFVLSYFQGFIMATVTQKVTKQLRTDISTKINRLPLRYFDSNNHGDILSRVTNDIDTIGQTLNQSLGQLVTAISLFSGSLIMMFYTNVLMAISAVLSTAIGFILMILIIKQSQKFFRQQQKSLGELNGHVEEIYTGHNIVKAFNGEESAINEFNEINNTLFDSAWKSQYVSGLMMPLMGFIGNFGYVVVCVVGAYLAFNDYITFGVIVAFMLYIRFFTQPLSQIAQAFTSLQSAAAASERVFDLLEEEELEAESEKATSLGKVKGDVTFKHVTFGYDPGKKIIKDFSLEAKAGQKIAIVGPTGAGKTTLVNLLMRFYEVNSGEIYIDGMKISSVTRGALHEQFCMVLQETWLFEGTVRENIVYSKQGVSDETVINACKAVGVHHFIQTLPHGYDTVLDDTTSLSAGQKQLMTIARALVADAPLLILDEATSSVDTRTELVIQNAMDHLMSGRTSFVIAHRLSTIKNADLIIVMKDGDVVESGNHDVLLEKNGFYADLYNSQFDQEEE